MYLIQGPSIYYTATRTLWVSPPESSDPALPELHAIIDCLRLCIGSSRGNLIHYLNTGTETQVFDVFQFQGHSTLDRL